MSVQAARDFIAACREGRVSVDDLPASGSNPRAALCRLGAEAGYAFDGDELERALGFDTSLKLIAARRRGAGL
jgi:hypothetical protein